MLTLDKDLQSVQEARNLVTQAKEAQKILATMSPCKVDNIVHHMATTLTNHAEELAQMAHEETGFGKTKDKILKNLFASKRVYEHIKDLKVLGIIAEDKLNKTMDVGVPVGVISALIPSTNPTSTAIYKALIAVKSGNAIVFSPHPNAKKCSKRAVELLQQAAVEVGAPSGLIGILDTLSLAGTKELMAHQDVAMILATGGGAMVKAAYSTGKPTISGGPGNGPAVIESSADVPKAVRHIVQSKTFDNGVICASEQSIIVEKAIETTVRQELLKNGAYFMTNEESRKIARVIYKPNGAMNAKVVGKPATYLANEAGINIPANTTVLISEQTNEPVCKSNPYAREKLCPVLAFYVRSDWQEACHLCEDLLNIEGLGHTLVLHSQNEAIVREFALRKPVYRLVVNSPAALGGIGATTNMTPALTLGCGSLGKGSSSDNVGPQHLINVRKVAYGVKELSELGVNSPNDETNKTNSDLTNLLEQLLASLKGEAS